MSAEHQELNIVIWAKVTIMLCGIAFIGLLAYMLILFKPIADISMLHCVNVIREEARLTEYAAILDLERQKLDEEMVKNSLAQARTTPTR
jgi:hypothetical protein